jgi:hypothetical protein
MNRAKGTRARLGVLIAAALGALALLALPGLSAARDGNHGHKHHRDTTGTIASFDSATGLLTIDLFGKDTVDGLVTKRTKIKCEDEHAPDVSDRRRHGENEPGDDHGHHKGNGPNSNSGPSGHDDNGTGANCTASDLVVGAVVREAELEIEHGAATFREVELDD